ncbi:hypothetical protein AB0F90_03335 [Micromonospora chalcea]|uniref:hypothetical protein n=1 Tax=Micromonospora chalcea TaxID=1874 RepID=UPI003406CE79
MAAIVAAHVDQLRARRSEMARGHAAVTGAETTKEAAASVRPKAGGGGGLIAYGVIRSVTLNSPLSLVPPKLLRGHMIDQTQFPH